MFREKEMLRRLVTGVAIVCLMGGAAYAQEEEAVDSACAQQLTTAQESVQDKVDNNALSEADQEKIYALMDEPLLDAFAGNMAAAGLTEGEPIPDRLGSSDVGNVSQVIPTIQPMIGIAPTGMAIHTREFADAAVQPLARQGMLAAAKAMAMTTFDLLAEPARVKAAKEEFARRG